MKFTYLTEEEVNQIGEKRAAVSDYAIISGCAFSSDEHINNSNSLDTRTGYYWTRTSDNDGDARAVYWYGGISFKNVNARSVGSRPALEFSSIDEISANGVSGDIDRISFGTYLDHVASEEKQKKLNKKYKRGNLTELTDKYIRDSRKYTDYDKGFNPEEISFYQDDDGVYARVRVNSFYDGGTFKLSNGCEYKDNDYVWIKEEPVYWERLGNTLKYYSEKILYTVQFNLERNYDGDFSKTDANKYLQEHFSKDLLKRTTITKSFEEIEEHKSKMTKRKQNPYDFDFSDVLEEDIIEGAILSNVPCFLHGLSGDGKSERVEQLDPDPEIVYLANATLDSLNGKSVYNQDSGRMIDIEPTWYTNLKEKCEKEPDKIHILFFDELTNASEVIQGLAFNIILKGEVNGKWKLPENCRIVAAGNELKESRSSYGLSEPMFNRFAHVYIKTTTKDWLKWAITPNEEYGRLDYEDKSPKMKVHPAIYAFISYKSYLGDAVLRTEYNGETPNANPRKWKMASDVLYGTNKPQMLKALVGEDITRDFVNFCNKEVLTVEDIMSDNYNEYDYEMDLGEKYQTAIGLSSCNEEQIEKVRGFVKNLGSKETLTLFDNLWVNGNESRLEKLAELKVDVKTGGFKS